MSGCSCRTGRSVGRYELLLFVHITCLIVWLGAGILFHMLGFRADRAGDESPMRRIFDDLVAVANTVFIPSSLLVLVFGILLTLDGPWSFGDLWIVLGLAGFAIIFATACSGSRRNRSGCRPSSSATAA